MLRRPSEGGLVTDAHEAIQFLDSFLEGRRGYTALDVRAGVLRLAALCRRIELSPAGGPGMAQALNTAGDCLRRVRERLG